MKKYVVEVHNDGSQFWKNEHGNYHREDGPAIIFADGTQKWCHRGKLHREDGPAEIYADGTQYWYINGKQLSEKEFNSRKNTCVIDKVVVIDGVEYKLVPNKG